MFENDYYQIDLQFDAKIHENTFKFSDLSRNHHWRPWKLTENLWTNLKVEDDLFYEFAINGKKSKK